MKAKSINLAESGLTIFSSSNNQKKILWSDIASINQIDKKQYLQIKLTDKSKFYLPYYDPQFIIALKKICIHCQKLQNASKEISKFKLKFKIEALLYALLLIAISIIIASIYLLQKKFYIMSICVFPILILFAIYERELIFGENEITIKSLIKRRVVKFTDINSLEFAVNRPDYVSDAKIPPCLGIDIELKNKKSIGLKNFEKSLYIASKLSKFL